MVDQSASHVHIDAAVDQMHRHENKAKPGQTNHTVHGSVTHPLGSKIMVQGVKATQVSIMIQSSDQTVCASIAAPPSKTFEIEAVDLCYKPPQPIARQMWLPGWKKRKQDTNGSKGDVLQDINDKESTNSREEGGAFILKNVNCKAKAGEVLAIAGPSGAGKSTLLEVLAGSIRPSSPSSSLLINKQPMDVSSFRRISGFVPQHDALFPLLTVKETLMYSARLRLPSSVCREEKEKRVWSLMQELGLLHVADTKVGDNDQIRGISGGERRRVSIGMDVIHDPSVLLLDEPTSGLDSAAALNVVEMLHCMAKTRCRTIILSIHQPGYRIMQHITSFLLLAKGRVVHLGSLNLLERQLVEAGHKIPSQVNVLEYAIEEMSLAGADHLSGGLQLKYKNGSSVRDHFAEKNGQLMMKMDDEVRGLGSLKGNLAGSGAGGGSAGGEVIGVMVGPGTVAGEEKLGYANGGLAEVVILSQRFGKNIFRTYDLFVARTLQAVVAGFALGSIYARVGEDPRGAAERLGFFAFTLTFLLSSTVEALPVFIKERQVLERETSRGAYRVASYVAANAAVFAPFLLLVAALYAVPVYYLIGLSRTAGAFGFFVLVMWLVLLEANAFVAFFGAVAPDFIMGNSLISGSMGAFFLFSGYFISKQDMPPYWRFMHYISLFKYPLDALLTNEYASLPPSACFDGLPRHHGQQQQQDPCLVTPDLILQQLGLLHHSKWLDLAVMLAFIVAYRFLAYAVLAVKVAKRRN